MPSDKRVGAVRQDRIEWPQTDINGNPYIKPPASTRGIGPGFFVVLPYGYVDDGTIDELAQRYSLSADKPAAKSKRSLADEGNIEDEAGE